MLKFKRPVFILGLSLALTMGVATLSNAQTAASITVNSGTTITSFVPGHVFGNNMAYWISTAAYDAVSAKVQAAGNYFFRYPGRLLLGRFPLERNRDLGGERGGHPGRHQRLLGSRPRLFRRFPGMPSFPGHHLHQLRQSLQYR